VRIRRGKLLDLPHGLGSKFVKPQSGLSEEGSFTEKTRGGGEGGGGGVGGLGGQVNIREGPKDNLGGLRWLYSLTRQFTLSDNPGILLLLLKSHCPGAKRGSISY